MSALTHLLLSSLLVLPCCLEAADLPLGDVGFVPTPERPVGYRGDGSGVFPGARPGTDFAPVGGNLRWRADLPRPSGGSPIVVGKLVVITSDPDLVLAFDADSGKPAWQADSAWTEGLPADQAAAAQAALATATGKDKSLMPWKLTVPGDGQSFSLPTPASDGQRIYVKCSTGTVCAYGLDGKRRWRHADPGLNLTPMAGSSPIVVGGNVIYLAASPDKRTLIATALDAASGVVAWKTTGLTRSGYRMSGTPLATRIGDQAVIILPTGDVLRAGDGTRLEGQVTASVLGSSPVVVGSTVFATFAPSGPNGHTLPEQWLHAQKLAISGTTLTATEVFRLNRSSFTLSPPLVHQGVVTIVGAKGLERYRLDDGTSLPIPGRLALPTNGHAFWPAPSAAGDVVMLVNLAGEVHVLAATDGRLLASTLVGPMNASPWFQGTRTWIRTNTALFCFGRSG